MNVFRFLKLKKAYQKVCSFIIAVSFLIPPLKWPQPTTK